MIVQDPKVEQRKNDILCYLNIALLLCALGFGIFAIASIFMTKWPWVLGFAILHVASMWIFRHTPWPVTRSERLKRELKQAEELNEAAKCIHEQNIEWMRTNIMRSAYDEEWRVRVERELKRRGGDLVK